MDLRDGLIVLLEPFDIEQSIVRIWKKSNQPVEQFLENLLVITIDRFTRDRQEQDLM